MPVILGIPSQGPVLAGLLLTVWVFCRRLVPSVPGVSFVFGLVLTFPYITLSVATWLVPGIDASRRLDPAEIGLLGSPGIRTEAGIGGFESLTAGGTTYGAALTFDPAPAMRADKGL